MPDNPILDESGNHIQPFNDTGPHTKVGIFWVVDDAIIGDAVYLHEAKPYTNALQHGGHHDFWLRLKPSTDNAGLCPTVERIRLWDAF